MILNWEKAKNMERSGSPGKLNGQQYQKNETRQATMMGYTNAIPLKGFHIIKGGMNLCRPLERPWEDQGFCPV